MPQHTNIVLPIVTATFFGSLGIVLMFFPNHLKKFYDRYGGPTFPVTRKYTDKPFYIAQLRVGGFLAFLLSLYITIGLLGLLN